MKTTTPEAVRPARVDFAEPMTPSQPAAPSVPPDLAREGARRLRFVVWASLAANLFFLVIGLVAKVEQPSASRTIGLAASVTDIALSIGVLWLATKSRLAPRTILDVALVYEVLDALLISLSYYPFRPDHVLVGWSGVAVWVLVFPLIIPNTRGKIIVATIASALMDPLGALIQIAAGAPAPPLRTAILAYATTAFAAAIGIIVSRLIFHISVKASRARELGSFVWSSRSAPAGWERSGARNT